MLSLVTINHKNCPEDILQKFSLIEDKQSGIKDKTNLLIALKAIGIEGALVLSTCNRTEIYIDDKAPKGIEAFKILCELKNLNYEEYTQYAKVKWLTTSLIFSSPSTKISLAANTILFALSTITARENEIYF